MTPIFHRIRTTLALGILCAAPLGHTAYAASDAWPERPIHLVSCCVGIIENIARVVGDEMARELNQSIVVESKPGASGMIAAEYISRAKPDGYNIFVGTNSSHGANQSLFKQVPYDFVNDFVPIGGIASGKIVLVVGPNSPIHSVAELTAYSKENPGKLDYGWASSSTRVAMEMYKQLADVNITDVPYKTNPQATMDVAGGQIDLMFADLSTAVPMIQSGKLRALAISGTTRVDALPDVPTMEEAGVPGYDLTWWMALWAPANTPEHVVKAMNSAVSKAITTPKVLAAFQGSGLDPMPLSPEELMQFQVAEHEKWRDIIKAAGIPAQ